MDDHVELCSRLFSAAKYEFKHMEFYYFHNCIYERLWKDNIRRWQEQIPTYEVLHKYNSDYKCIIVGDASMSPWELMYQNGSVEHNNEEPGPEMARKAERAVPIHCLAQPGTEGRLEVDGKYKYGERVLRRQDVSPYTFRYRRSRESP